MTTFALLFTLSAIGISETVYLIRKRIAAEAPVCPIGEGCETVLTSKYSKLFIIPNDILGLLGYVVIAIIAAFLVIGINVNFWAPVLKILVVFAAVLSLFFTYLQKYKIRAWCFWCLMSAFTIWLMGLIIILSSLI